jgi:beta-1,4-galactosyltransferase 1
MNIGFVEALKQRRWQCFIFHDVDLLPEDDRNVYSCPEMPRHMSVAVDTMAYRCVQLCDLIARISLWSVSV